MLESHRRRWNLEKQFNLLPANKKRSFDVVVVVYDKKHKQFQIAHTSDVVAFLSSEIFSVDKIFLKSVVV
jgi:hypothetical protein